MTENRVEKAHHATFEQLRHLDDEGNEYWLARELAVVLDYSQYRHFLAAVKRARAACQNSRHTVDDHFEDILTMVPIGSTQSLSPFVKSICDVMRRSNCASALQVCA